MNKHAVADVSNNNPDSYEVLLERVELLCAVHALAVGTSEISAQSLSLAELVLGPWRTHGAFQLVGNLSKQLPRDALIKGLVQALVGLETAPAHGRMLRRTLEDLAAHAGAQLTAVTQGLRTEMLQRTGDLLNGFDPAKEIGEACGQTVRMRFTVRPMLFLPLPPDGRHGVFTIGEDGWKEIYMFFGISLGRPLADAGITPRWLQRGGWHYAIHEVIDQCRQALGVNACPLDESQQALIEALPPYVGKTMESVFLNHLSMAIRWVPWKKNLKREVFVLLGQSQGLMLVDWFVERVERYLVEDRPKGIPLVATVPAMFRAFIECDRELRALALQPRPSVPPIISCALLPLWSNGARLVVPAEWLADGSKDSKRIQKAAADLRMLACSHQEWWNDPELRGAPAILFASMGEPGVRSMLEASEISVREDHVVFNGKAWQGGDYTVAILVHEEDLEGNSPWRIIVCGQDADRLIRPSADRLLRLPYTAVLLKDDIPVDGIRSDAIATELVDLT